jgi:predicted RNA-binding Zn-ribbon protein involved in translation (DUF1610 family)
MSIPEWDDERGLELQREVETMLPPGQGIAFARVPAPDGNGDAYALYVAELVDGFFFPGCPIVAVTDEKLLAKLRSVKGQYIYRYEQWAVPVFYYEYCKMDPRQRIVPDQSVKNVPCPQCGVVYHSEAAHIGKHLRCARCGAVVPICSPKAKS